MANAKDVIKNTYKRHFFIDLSQKEIDEEAKILYLISKNKYVNEVGNDVKLYEYRSTHINGLAFSPPALMKLVQRKLNEPNSDYFKTKEFVEIVSAANFVTYIVETTGKKWHIILRDSPDIKLLDAMMVSFNRRRRPHVSYIEVMQFPQLSLENLKTHFISLLIKELRDKKFPKRYSKCSLLINMMSNEPTKGQIELVSNMVSIMKGNPYSAIYLTNIPLFSKVLRMDLLFPRFKPAATFL